MGRINILNKIKVLDLTVAVAGPVASKHLGDLGAEVIRIEMPGGDMVHNAAPKFNGQSFYRLAVNRNKKSIVLDLKTKLGRDVFYDLVRVSDVVIDNLRPGVIEKLGADFDALRKINPRIISCSITGFGPTGPYSDYPCFDDVAQGISGLSSLSGEPGGDPIRSPIPIGDLASASFSVAGIIAALYDREHSGKGQRVEVNLINALMSYLLLSFQAYFITGKVPQRQGSKHSTSPMVGIFRTRNGHVVLGPCWPRIAYVIGMGWMIDDPRFNSVEKRFENKKELEALIEEGLSQADSEDWVELLRAEDIPVGPIHTLDKTIDDPQVVHNQSIITMYHPQYGEVKDIECPIKARCVNEEEHLPPPILGQHTKEILQELLGYSDEKIEKLMQYVTGTDKSQSSCHVEF